MCFRDREDDPVCFGYETGLRAFQMTLLTHRYADTGKVFRRCSSPDTALRAASHWLQRSRMSVRGVNPVRPL